MGTSRTTPKIGKPQGRHWEQCSGHNQGYEGEVRLVELARAGCDQALGQLFQRFNDYLILVADQNLGDDLRPKFGASDIVQESLLEAGQKISQFRGKSGPEIRAWLRTLLMRNLIDGARQFRNTQSRNISIERPLTTDSSVGSGDLPASRCQNPSWVFRKREDDEELRRAIAELPDRQRTVLLRHYRDQEGFSQIGESLGITESAARKIQSQAIVRLRLSLNDTGGQ